MLEDAGAPVLITHERWLGLFPDSGVRVVCLDRDRELPAGPIDRDPSLAVDSESLAYVIYTSGSTGKPKGVAVSHRAIVRLLRDTNYIDLGPDDVVAQLPTPRSTRRPSRSGARCSAALAWSE